MMGRGGAWTGIIPPSGTYLVASNNLSDLTSVATALENLGFNPVTQGYVYFGNGTSQPASSANFFFDNANNRVGINNAAPSKDLHILRTTQQPTSMVESQSTANEARFELRSSRTALANLVAADFAGTIAFAGQYNSTEGDLAYVRGVYTGSGTTQVGDLVFYNANSGAPAETFRIQAAGTLKVAQLGAGALSASASGVISSGTLSFGNGGTGATGFTASQVVVVNGAGTALTGVASVPVTAGGTGLIALGTANQLLATNAGATAMNWVAITATVAGLLQTASGAVGGVGVGVGASNTGMYSPNASQVALAAGGAQVLLATTTLLTVPIALQLNTTLAFEGSSSGAATLQAAAITTNYTLTLPAAAPVTANSVMVSTTGGALSFQPIPSSFKANKVTLAQGITSKAIAFNTTNGDANYLPIAFLVNTTDTPANMIYVPVQVVAISATGFTAEWPDPTPTANYSLYWGIMEFLNP